MTTFNLDQIKLPADEADAFYQRLAQRIAKLPQAGAVGVGPALWFFGGRILVQPRDINRLNLWIPEVRVPHRGPREDRRVPASSGCRYAACRGRFVLMTRIGGPRGLKSPL